MVGKGVSLGNVRAVGAGVPVSLGLGCAVAVGVRDGSTVALGVLDDGTVALGVAVLDAALALGVADRAPTAVLVALGGAVGCLVGDAAGWVGCAVSVAGGVRVGGAVLDGAGVGVTVGGHIAPGIASSCLFTRTWQESTTSSATTAILVCVPSVLVPVSRKVCVRRG